MLNIVIISPGFAIDENDSICLPFLQVFIKNLILQPDIQLRIITELYPEQENYIWNNIEVFTLKKRKDSLLKRIWKKNELKNCLNLLHQLNKIDIVHHFWISKNAQTSAKFCLDNNIKHILTMAGQDVLTANKYLSPAILKYSKLFCLSQFHLNKLHENTKVEAAYINWGIEPMNLIMGEKSIDLIFCGWINEIKNVPQFIEIVNELHKQKLIKRVVMCGGGAGLKQLKVTLKKLKLDQLVELKGETPRNEVLAYMQQSEILVHTSNFESFGMVLIEALNCACHVVSKPVGIAYQNNQIHTCTSNEDFVLTIKKILIQNKWPIVQNNFKIEDTVQAYLKIYNE